MKISETSYDVVITMTHADSRQLTAELYSEEWSFPTMGTLKDETKATTRLIHALLTGDELPNE